MPSHTRRQLLKWLVQLVLAAALLLVVLGLAARLARDSVDWWPELPDWPAFSAALVWTMTLLLSVPILGVALSKLRVLAVVYVDMRDVPETDSLELAPDRAGRLLLLGAIFLGLGTLAACLGLGTPLPVTLGLLALHVLLTRISFRGLRQFYQQIGC